MEGRGLRRRGSPALSVTGQTEERGEGAEMTSVTPQIRTVLPNSGLHRAVSTSSRPLRIERSRPHYGRSDGSERCACWGANTHARVN
jgi:hypothetical protein